MRKNLSYVALSVLVVFSACSKKKYKSAEKMDMDELQKQAKACMDQGDKGFAISYLENMIEKYPDHKDLSESRLTLGDLYFEKKNYIAADKCYEKFVHMNPSRGEYAAYRSILSKFYQTLSVDRDPSMILRTLEQCKRYLAINEYSSSKYAKDVNDIFYTCERKLIDREIYVYNFYLREGKFKSAENRLNYIREAFLEKHPDIEPRILYLEGKLAHRDKKRDEAATKVDILIKQFPDSQYTAMAQRMLSKKNDFIFF